MRKINNTIKNTVLCIFALMLSVSCLREKENAAGKQNVMVEIKVSAGQFTKATPTSKESTISTLDIYAYLRDELVGTLSLGQTEPGTPFLMDLTLPDGPNSVDFYLVANASSMLVEGRPVAISQNPTKAEVENIRYSSLAAGSVLPLFGQANKTITVDASQIVSTAAGHNGHLMLSDKVTFDLYRSLAKLSVFAAKIEGAMNQPKILSATLLAQGTREYSYLFPQNDDVLDQVASRITNRVLSNTTTTINASVEKGSSEALDPSNYTQVVDGVYMPEVREGSADCKVFDGPVGDETRAAVIHVEYSLGDGQDRRDGYIYMPSIERNHHYKVCILISAEGQIMLNYTVAEWDWDTDKMQDWFFDYPTHTYLWHKIPQTEEDLLEKPAGKATMSESHPFVAYFQMTYPESDKWMPTLEGLNASYCDVKVYDAVTDAEFTPPMEVSDDWYRIEVTPKSGYMTSGEVVNLAITYTPSLLTESEYLLINGSVSDYFWPESTSENFVTITMVN